MQRHAEHYGLDPGKGFTLGVLLGGAMWIALGYSLHALWTLGAM